MSKLTLENKLLYGIISRMVKEGYDKPSLLNIISTMYDIAEKHKGGKTKHG